MQLALLVTIIAATIIAPGITAATPLASDTTAPSPLGETTGPTIHIPPRTTRAPIKIPLETALPGDTRAISIWLRTPHPDDRIRFHFRDTDGPFVITENHSEGAPVEPPQWGVRYSTHARINDWTLRQSTLTGRHVTLALTHIEIITRHPDAPRALHGPIISAQATPRSQATLVWKLKDFVIPKQSSLNWTATHYYEYGYDRPAAIPPVAWRQTLFGKIPPSSSSSNSTTTPISAPARLDLLLRAANGAPLRTWTLTPPGLSPHSTIPLPRLPEGAYFLDLTARDAHDTLAAQGRIVYQVLRDDTRPPVPHPATPVALPFQLEGITRDGAAIQAGSSLPPPLPATLRIRPLPGWTTWPLTARWTVRTTDGLTLADATHTFTAAPATHTPRIQLPAAQPGAFLVTATLTDASHRPLDHIRETYGVRPPPANSSAATTPRPPLDYDAIHTVSLAATHYDRDQIRRLPTDTLPHLINRAATARMSPSIGLNWHGVAEPVQGCYQWRFFDKAAALAREQGHPALWTGISYTGDGLPEWLWFEELMDQHQQTIHAEYHYVSPFGPRFRTARNRLHEDFLTRHRDDPRLAGVLLYSGPSEGYITDTGPMIADYSPPAREAFRTYLKKRYNTDLAALNRRWHTSFETWGQVLAPLPDWSLPWESSPSWWDFHSFKADWILEDLGEFFARSRAAAPDLPLMSYGKEGFGGTGRLAPVFRKNRIRYTNGGGETQASYVQTSIMRGHGVPSNPEGHYVMPNIGSVSMVIANSLWAGQYQGQNIMWGLVWTKTPHVGVPEYEAVARLTAAMDRHAAEMHNARPLQPWAGYFGATRAMLESRSFRNPLNAEASGLASVSGGVLHNLCSWVDDGSEPAALRRYHLIVDSGAHIVAPDALAPLLDYVNDGGTFVATTDTARHLAGSPATVDALLRDALGAASIERSVQKTAVTDAGRTLVLARLDRIEWRAGHSPAPGAEAILRTVEGQPLVWSVPRGKGRFLILCGAPDWKKSAAWLDALAGAVVGPRPCMVSGDNVIARPLRSPDADYIVFVAMMPDRGLNHTHATLTAAPRRTVTVSGIHPGITETAELLSGRNIPVTDGRLTLDAIPGIVHIVKIPRDVR
jgi:hypothetical protein